MYKKNLISEFDFMHFKFCTVILIIKNNDSEDFWFQLWHGKHLKLKSPSLQERKDLNILKINDFLKPSKNWSHRKNPLPNLSNRENTENHSSNLPTWNGWCWSHKLVSPLKQKLWWIARDWVWTKVSVRNF